MATLDGKGFNVDPTQPEYFLLCQAAQRIETVLADAQQRHEPHLKPLTATLDVFLGALYALLLATHEGYQHRSGEIDPKAIEQRARDVTVGTVRTEGK